MVRDDVADARSDARVFAIEEIEPYASQVDRDNAIPGELKDRFAAQGYYGRLLPEDYGGQGASYSELCAQQEGLAYGSMAVASTMMASSLCSLPILRHGTDEQKERFVSGLTTGERVGTIGITEPSYGSDAAGMQTRARRDGDEWVLDGEKWLIASGFLTASVFMRMFVDFFVDPERSNGVPGAGLGELAWHEPVRPGDTLRVRTEILRTEPPDDTGLGVVHFRSTVYNQDDSRVMTLEPKGHFEAEDRSGT